MSKKKKIVLWIVGLAVIGVGSYFIFKPMTVPEAVAIIRLKAPSANYQPGIMEDAFLIAWAKALEAAKDQFLYKEIVFTSKDGHPYRP